MFIALPYSTHLHISARAYVTYAVCVLCLAVQFSGIDMASLVYYPDSWNPVMMLVSSVSHAGWGHIIGNLIFFLAFSPAAEVIVGSVKKYIAILIAIAFIDSITYSLTSLFEAEPVPTLGLSGVVMGVIGLSAYLMPKARIKVFVWFLVFIRTVYIPAWILAAWFIGWDTWDLLHYGNSNGINLVSHVSGGIAGYLIGFFWMKDRREEISEELEDAIEYARSERQDATAGLSYSGGRGRMEREQNAREAAREHNEYMSQLYQLVQADNDSEAVLLFLKDYELQKLSVEIYEELFERMNEWGKKGRAIQCLGRLCIQLRLDKNDNRNTINMLLKCQSIFGDDFVIGEADKVLILVWRLINMGHALAALHLIQDADTRYGDAIDRIRCKLIEIEILAVHLHELDKAKAGIRELLSQQLTGYRDEILALAKRMQ
jgi:membrane associated rhomboid family serine protease